MRKRALATRARPFTVMRLSCVGGRGDPISYGRRAVLQHGHLDHVLRLTSRPCRGSRSSSSLQEGPTQLSPGHMQLASASFARAVRVHDSSCDARRIAFDVELSDRTRAPAFVECHGDGIFRLRIGPSTLPDYGLVLSQPRALHAQRDADGSLRIEAGTAALIIGAGSAARNTRARRRRCPALDHRRAFSRLDALSGVRPRRRALDRRRCARVR